MLPPDGAYCPLHPGDLANTAAENRKQEEKKMAVALSDRCTRIRQAIIDTDPIICPERAVLWTESYQNTESDPPVVRAAKALKHT